MTQKFANAARAYLASSISDSATTIAIDGGGSLFPAIASPQFSRAVLQDANGIEVVLITAHTADSDSFTVTRGQEGTTARSFAAGSVFGIRMTAADGDTFVAKVSGPSSATDSALAAFDGTTGKLVKQAATVTVAQGGTGQTSFTNGQLLIGNSTGNTLTKATLTAGCGVTITNGAGSITISAAGGGGGGSPATPTVAGVVFGKTNGALGVCGDVDAQTALGNFAGATSQACQAVAVGSYSANFGQGGRAVAIGAYAGYVCQGACAIAIGAYAGQYYQGANSIAIGKSTSASGCGAVALGKNTTSCYTNTVAIGFGTGATCISCRTHIGPIRNACSTSGLQGLFYNACTREVISGAAGGGSPATPTTEGTVYGKTQLSGAGGRTALGTNAGLTSQGTDTVAVGTCAGKTSQGNCAIAIGRNAGEGSQGGAAVAIGSSAGFGCQSSLAVAIGASAGVAFQGLGAVAIGASAGAQFQGGYAISIGAMTGICGSIGQGLDAIAIGRDAGANYQGGNSIAIGVSAGSCFQPANSIAIGAATVTAGTCQTHIGPIRNGCSPFTLKYCPCTREITYN
jgi:hypothetical protein